MKKLISFNQAIRWSTLLFGLFIVFHLAVILAIMVFEYAPVDYLWGGRMKTSDELLKFELISLAVMTFCLFTVLVRSGLIRLSRLVGASRVFLWILTILFLLNTVGNILAQSTFEKYFAIITLIFAALSLRLAIEPIKSR